MMDFIRLVFKVEPMERLMGKPANKLKKVGINSDNLEDGQKMNEGLMSEFLDRFRVKR